MLRYGLHTSLPSTQSWRNHEGRDDPIPAQHQALSRKLRGHYAYYGVTSNIDALKRFREVAQTVWKRWLSRRSQTGHVTWDRMHLLLERFPLPKPRIVHRYGT